MPGTVVSLLHCDGTNGSTTLPDTGIGARTWTAHNGAALSTAVHAFGTASIALDGVDDYFETPASTDFEFAGDFTISFRAKKSADGANSFDTVLTTDTSDGSAVDGWFLELSDGRGFVFAFNLGVVISASTTVSDGALHAWAIDRSGTTVRLYKDGVVLATATDATTYTAVGPLGIGRNANAVSFTFAGNLDEIQVLNGQALYAGAYTPETSAFTDPSPGSQTGTATGIAPTTAFGTPFAVFGQTGQASGFSSTVFGTPLASFTQIGVATGFSSTALGVPTVPLVATGIAPTTAFGTPRLIPAAVGFRSTVFGIPSIPLVATGIAPATAFGTPTGTQRFKAQALGPTTQFGTPTTPTNRTGQATGFSSTVMGVPTLVSFVPPLLDQLTSAIGFSGTAFGTPSVSSPIACDTTGFSSTAFGTPTGSTNDRCIASSIDPQTTFGTPTAAMQGQAAGFKSTAFGSPASARGQRASSVNPTTRFGLPTASGGAQAHRARGIGPVTRFGQPRATNRINRTATGIASTTAFGTPTALEIHRATALPSTTQFGTPLLKRNPLC